MSTFAARWLGEYTLLNDLRPGDYFLASGGDANELALCMEGELAFVFPGNTAKKHHPYVDNLWHVGDFAVRRLGGSVIAEPISHSDIYAPLLNSKLTEGALAITKDDVAVVHASNNSSIGFVSLKTGSRVRHPDRPFYLSSWRLVWEDRGESIEIYSSPK